VAPQLAHKRRVRVDTNLPEPAPRRHGGIPVVGCGLVAWVVAVLAGAALMYPSEAERWYAWARDAWSSLRTTSRGAGPSGESVESEVASAFPVPAGADATGLAGSGPGVADLVVQEQAGGGAGTGQAAAPPMTCEGAIRSYREAVLAGDAGPPRPIRENGYADTLQNGIYLRECEVADEVMVDVCAAIRGGRVVGVTVQTSPHRPLVARCLAKAVRSLEVDEPSVELDVSHAHFDPRWR